VTENSMSPALQDGDYVIATRLVSAPLRGDVVVFAHPATPGFLMIKRVIGLPGEAVRIEHGQIAANGHLLAEPWANGAIPGAHDWHLDGRHLVVLSDNRTVSTEDSRELGPLPMGDLWRVGFRYWPPGRVGRIR
ncbi:MAG: signal peptidase I, partial [bacterium]|nr:signal peptidase I [bacterium]